MIRVCSSGHICGTKRCPRCGATSEPVKVTVSKLSLKPGQTIKHLRSIGKV